MQEACVVCRQGQAHEIVEADEVRLPGLRFVIADDRRMRCERCAAEYYTGEQADEHQKKVDAQKRAAFNPMTPDEIRALRAQADLSQNKLEEVMGLGSNTVQRWERGVAVPSRVVDNLLRLASRDPSVLPFLAERAGVTLSPKGKPGRKKGGASVPAPQRAT